MTKITDGIIVADRIQIRDPGSDAFSAYGSGVQKKKFVSRIPELGSRIRIPKPILRAL
jgi:hypothetical protein